MSTAASAHRPEAAVGTLADGRASNRADEPRRSPQRAIDEGAVEEAAARYRRVGVWSAALLALALSLTWALSVPAFWGVDETSHVAYAVSAAGGDWPTIHTPNPRYDLPGLQDRINYDISFGRLGRLDIWTSNHPPLYFALVGIPMRLGLALDAGGAGMLVARMLTAVGGSAGVLAVAWVAKALAPARPRAHVVAAFTAALSPTLVHYAGQIYNDTLGFTLSTFGLAAGFAALRGGLSRRLLIIGAVAAGTGALTRSSGLAPAALTVAAFMLAAWFHAPQVTRRTILQDDLGAGPGAPSLRRRSTSAIRIGTLVGGVIAVISGWAVVVNLVRYGDPTAASDLFQKFHRVEGPPWTTILFDGDYLIDQIDRFATELSIGVWWPSIVTMLAYVVIGAALIGGALAGTRRWRNRRPPSLRATLLWALAVALPTMLLVTSAIFISQGGYPHSRYLLPGLSVLAVLLALGIDGLPAARRGIPALAALSLLSMANIALWVQFRADHQLWYQEVFPFVVLPQLAPVQIAVAVGVTLGAIALAGLVQAITGLSDPDDDEPAGVSDASSSVQAAEGSDA